MAHSISGTASEPGCATELGTTPQIPPQNCPMRASWGPHRYTSWGTSGTTHPGRWTCLWTGQLCWSPCLSHLSAFALVAVRSAWDSLVQGGQFLLMIQVSA